jgi:uncharacterized heparinase superfamily protein
VTPADTRHPARGVRLLWRHFFLRPWWRFHLSHHLLRLTDEEFDAICGIDRKQNLKGTISQEQYCFFFHPRNRKEFFLSTLSSIQSYDSILDDAEDTLNNRFQTLGSPKVELGARIRWQLDFKSGKEWPLRPLTAPEILDLDHPSDVKVPWELGRFHQVWWLGKAYWITGNERYAQKFAELIEDWIDHNPVGRGVHWIVAMETAVRAANWIAGYFFFCESKSLPEEFWKKFMKSLYVQGQFIRNNLEYSRANGNHFLSDIIGLLFLGIFFKQARFGKKWLAWATRNLENEMQCQVLPDGVDFEKSTAYHRLVLELFYSAAVLCKINKVTLSEAFWKRLEKMFEFVQYYTRPDGSIPLWGDADDGRLFRFQMNDDTNDHRHALAVAAILFGRGDFKLDAGKFYQDALWLFGGEGFERWQSTRIEPQPLLSRAFPDGGFYILRTKDVHLFIDAGELGQRGRGGHGHNDTLSFELWLNNTPMIVDPGTYAYTFDPHARQEFRSTRAHNTSMIDGREIADFDGMWSVKNDTTAPKVIQWNSNAAQDLLIAEHYGYRRLAQPVTHRRSFTLNKSNSAIQIRDEFLGNGKHVLEWRLCLAPSVVVQLPGESEAVIKNGPVVLTVRKDGGRWKMEDGWYSPSYGVRQRTRVLSCTLSTSVPFSSEITITPNESSAK